MGKHTVLYLNHSAQMSGAEASLRSLLLGLRQIDAPIDPVVALPGEGPLSIVLREEGVKVAFAPLRRLQRPRGLVDGMASLLHVMQTAPHLCRLVEQTGTHIVHSNSTTAHLVGAVAAERTKRPSLWHCRDLVSLARIAPQLAAKSTGVIAISECVAESLEKDGVPREKIKVVYNGLDPDAWRAKGPSPLRETLGIKAGTFVFGMAGQLVPWKNHRLFIEAAAQLVQNEGAEHLHFLIVGGDLWNEQEAYVKELRDLIKSHNLTTHFNLVPHQSDAVGALSAFDCLVHPATEEPFGRVLIEAMALEKPVVAMNENGPREIVAHERDGLLVDSAQEDGLVKAMNRVRQDADLRAALGAAARRKVEEQFHIARHASKMAEIYAGLVG